MEGAASIAGIVEDDVLARAGTENFPVSPRLLPRHHRRHLLALYGFARLVDHVGDEVVGDRLALLDEVDRELTRVFAGTPQHPVFVRLHATIEECDLPERPFRDLVEANRLDQHQTRYATFDDLLAYCRLSADPIGRLVLAVFGAGTHEQVEQSDRICTSLQLVEHWQDVAEDLVRGRIYLPEQDRARFGVSEDDLRERRAAAPVRALLAFEVGRARDLLWQGSPLVRTLHGPPRVAVAGFVGGGRAALDAIERARFDVLVGPPRPRRLGVLRHAALVFATGGSR